MNPLELTFGLIIVVLLVGLAVFFGWRQRRTLRTLRLDSSLPDADRSYLRTQAVRRLVCSGLMLLLAALLVGSYLFEEGYQELTQQVHPPAPATGKPVLRPDERAFVQGFTFYWILILAVLFLFAVVAALDIRSTLRFGLAKHRQLEHDHRAALQAHLQQIRERNGRKGQH